ncbi:MAG: NfeD family protein [Phormidesmis sp.]
MSKPNFFPEALEATIEEPVYPGSRGRIRCHGIFYRAEMYCADGHLLCPGERVYMVGIRDNVALIKP